MKLLKKTLLLFININYVPHACEEIVTFCWSAKKKMDSSLSLCIIFSSAIFSHLPEPTLSLLRLINIIPYFWKIKEKIEFQKGKTLPSICSARFKLYTLNIFFFKKKSFFLR